MNQLKVAEVQAILTLASRGWSFRRIAEALGIRRETVSKYVEEARAAPKAAKAPTGSDEADEPGAGPAAGLGAAMGEPEPAEAPAGSEAPSASRSGCERYRELILGKLKQDLSAQRIWQDLTTEHRAAVSYYSVRRFVRQLGSGVALPFRRLECAPGHESAGRAGRETPARRPRHARRPTMVDDAQSAW